MKKLNIVSLLREDKIEEWSNIEEHWEKYFYVTHVIDSPKNIKSYVESKEQVDILFLDYRDYEKFDTGFYGDFKAKQSSFKYILVSDKPKQNDVRAYKAMADDIAYLSVPPGPREWKVIALLRRRWDNYSKKTTIIYKDIIADFLDRYVEVNRKEVPLTLKELKLFQYFLNNAGIYIDRQVIFEEVWNVKDADSTRTLDQMLFKLKKKIGSEYFDSSRTKGIKFE